LVISALSEKVADLLETDVADVKKTTEKE